MEFPDQTYKASDPSHHSPILNPHTSPSNYTQQWSFKSLS